MNERIQKLADKAEDYADIIVDAGGEFHPAYTKKFAELIVGECADIAREVGTNTVPEDFALDKCYEIEANIKQHFGIK